jgi:hypothetical protein
LLVVTGIAWFDYPHFASGTGPSGNGSLSDAAGSNKAGAHLWQILAWLELIAHYRHSTTRLWTSPSIGRSLDGRAQRG